MKVFFWVIGIFLIIVATWILLSTRVWDMALGKDTTIFHLGLSDIRSILSFMAGMLCIIGAVALGRLDRQTAVLRSITAALSPAERPDEERRTP